jgi:hypothetical protein
MLIEEMPTSELRRIAAATERAIGPDAPEVRTMRHELNRRINPKIAADLSEVVDAWPALPPDVRWALATMVRAAVSRGKNQRRKNS